VQGKTGRLYAACGPRTSRRLVTARMADEISAGRPLSADLLFNTFENVAFDVFPGWAPCATTSWQ